jgi:hypothetical protein
MIPKRGAANIGSHGRGRETPYGMPAPENYLRPLAFCRCIRRCIIVVNEAVDADTIYPVTAYEVPAS